MISPLDARTERFLADLDRINDRMSAAQAQIGSGLRINRISDAPDQISTLLAVRSELRSTEQIHANFNRIKGETDSAEQALQQSVHIMDRVATLAAEGATDIIDPAQRLIIASEVTGLLQQLVALASTATDGRYIFGGDSDQQAPYVYDVGGSPSYGTYQGSDATRQVLHPARLRVSISRTAEQIFEDPDPSRNVFGAVESLLVELRTGDTSGVTAALARVRAATVHLNNELGFYGNVQNQVATALDFASAHEIRLKTQIAAIEEADMAGAIVELNQAQIHQQATLQTQAKIQSRPNLFDYLR
jgi:flagellar hook-associated protein 3 FlgL